MGFASRLNKKLLFDVDFVAVCKKHLTVKIMWIGFHHFWINSIIHSIYFFQYHAIWSNILDKKICSRLLYGEIHNDYLVHVTIMSDDTL